jgi:hypothetical protein
MHDHTDVIATKANQLLTLTTCLSSASISLGMLPISRENLESRYESRFVKTFGFPMLPCRVKLEAYAIGYGVYSPAC